MGYYTVVNKTKNLIFWKDEAWYSGDLDINGERKVESNHNANVTMFEKTKDGDVELGNVWITNNAGKCTVHGKWRWDIG